MKDFLAKVVVSTAGGIAAYFFIQYLEKQASTMDNEKRTQKQLEALGQ